MENEMNNVPARMPEPQLPALPQEMSIEQVAARVNKVKELQLKLMREDVHWGKIPGTPKPTLLKPGAELMCLTFLLDPQYTHEIKQDGVHREITSRCVLYHIPTGNRVASGEGSCSTYESKYAWRKASPKCPSCGEMLRRSKNKDEWYCWRNTGGCGNTYPLKDARVKTGGREPNPDIPDQYNTVLKMANKRSLIAAILNATAASEIYTQDLEDFAEHRGDDEEVVNVADMAGRTVEADKARVATPTERETVKKATVSNHICPSCKHILMVSKFNADELYCNAKAGGCGKKFKAADFAAKEKPVVVKADQPITASGAGVLVNAQRQEVVEETKTLEASSTPAKKPLVIGQARMLRTLFGKAGMIQGDDTTKAVEWLSTWLELEVTYDGRTCDSADLDALMRTIDGNDLTELKEALEAEIQKPEQEGDDDGTV